MRTRRTSALAALAVTATLGLTACQDEAPPAPGQPTPSASQSTDQAAPGATPTASGGASSTAPQSDGSSEAPASSRKDAKDTSAIDATISRIPAGPVSDISITKLGGYTSKYSGNHGTFYAVLDVSANQPGLLDLEFVMLDANGKEVGTQKANLAHRGVANELKVVRALGAIPGGDTVKKVALRVTKNTPNRYATDAEIHPSIRGSYDSSSQTALVLGQYKTYGKGSVTSLNAVCSDAQGRVIAGNSPVSKIKADTWTDYKVSLFDAPKGYKPKHCYVGAN